MATEEEIQSFLSSPLVRWTTSLLPGGDDLSWQLLAKGVTLATLLEGLDASFQIAVDSDPIDTAARAKNILLILKSIKYFYKEILGQLLLISLPAPRDLSQIPPSTNSLASMETLLLLVLGVAVQSEQKQEVIITIKNLPLETQHEIVDRIRAITDNPNLVLSRELSNPEGLAEDQRDQMYCLLIEHAKRLVYERDELSEDLSSTRLELDSRITVEGSESTPVTTASNHALVEVAESKAKLRKLRQQLEEKTEQLQECREELEKISDTTAKLKAENLELCQDARAAKTYRDELDMVRERAEKVEKLEAEIMRYKDKMNDIEFFKSRVEELREDNRILVETKEMLEEQLGSSRKRCEAVLGLENDIIKFKGDIERLHQERDTDRNRIKELIEENSTLSFSHKTSMSESQSLLAEMDALKGVQGKELNILSEQLGKDAVSRVHRLELENKHLKQELENYRSVFSKKEREVVSEMEQEMRKSTMTVSRLEEQAKKDSQIILDAQQELTKVQQEHRSVEATLETLNEQFKLLQIERDTEVDALSKQVNSLSARAASSETQQLVSLQEENRKLVAERTVLKTQVSEFHPRIVSISKSLPLLAPKPGNNSVFTNNSQVPRSSVIPGFNPATIILTPLTSNLPSTILTIPLPSRAPNSDSLSVVDGKIMPQIGEYSRGISLQSSPEPHGFNSLPPSPPQLRIVEEKLDLEDIKEEVEFNESTTDEDLEDIKMDTQEEEEKMEGMRVYLKPLKEEEKQSFNPQTVESPSEEFNNIGQSDLPHCAAGNGDTNSCSGELFDLNALNQSLNLLDMKYKTAGPLTTPEKNVIKSRLGLAYWKADESPTWICSYHRHETVYSMDTKSCSQCGRKRANKGSGKMFVITYRMGLEFYMTRGKYLKIGLLVCEHCRIKSLKDLDFSDSVCVDDDGVGLEKNPFSLPSFAVTSPSSSTLLPRVLSSPSASISQAFSSPPLATTSLSSSTSGFSFPQKIIKGRSVSSKNDETEVITGSERSWQDLIFTKIENLNESLQAINPRYKPLGFSITNLDSLSAGVLQDAVNATRIALQTVLTSIAPGHEAELWSAVKPGLDASLLGPQNSDG